MDRLEAMSILLTAVEKGSLSAASRQLGKPLTTISRKVADLESYLNARLVTRAGRRLILTEAGRSYVAACRRILDDVREAERTAAGEYNELKGDLVITAPLILGRVHVLPIIAAFLKAHPGVNVQLVLSDRLSNLAEDQIDLAVRVGSLPDSSLIASHIGETRRIICGSPAYFAEHGVPRHPSELAQHDCVTIGGFMSATEWRFGVGETAMVITVQSRLVVSTAEAAMVAVTAGFGLTGALSFFSHEAVKSGALQVVLEEFEPAPMPVNLIYVGGRFLPQKLRAFCDFAAPRLKAALAKSVF
jgi:DNA-binding transcriptional LysR family regulator